MKAFADYPLFSSVLCALVANPAACGEWSDDDFVDWALVIAGKAHDRLDAAPDFPSAVADAIARIDARRAASGTNS